MTWWESFWRWADSSPIGSEVIGGLILAAIVAVVSLVPKLRKPLFRAVRACLRFVFSLRLTTADKVIKKSAHVLLARWVIVEHHTDKMSFVLVNTGDGKARNVTLTAESGYFRFLSGGQFQEVLSQAQATFKGVFGQDAYMVQSVDFRVQWTDSRGTVHHDYVPVSVPSSY